MARNEQLTLTIRARNLFVGTFRKATASIQRFAAGTVQAAKQVGVAFFAMGVAGALAFRKLFKLYTENARSQKKLSQAVRTTGGAAGFTATQLAKEAKRLHELTGVSEKVIKNAQAIQLTFLNIKGDHFIELTERALDLAEVMSEVNGEGVSLREGIVRLSKALNDPRTGMANLRRVGISFTQSQVEMAKALQDSGDLLGAQRLILDELDRELSGFAANADSTTKEWNKFKNSLAKSGAQFAAALLNVNNFEGGVRGLRQELDRLASSGKLEQAAKDVTAIAGAAAFGVRNASTGLRKLLEHVQVFESILVGDAFSGRTMDEKISRAFDVIEAAAKASQAELKTIRERMAKDAVEIEKRETDELAVFRRRGLVKSTADIQFDLSKQIEELGKLGEAARKAIDPLSSTKDLLAKWPSLRPGFAGGDMGKQLERTFQDVETVATATAMLVEKSINRERWALDRAATAAKALQAALGNIDELSRAPAGVSERITNLKKAAEDSRAAMLAARQRGDLEGARLLGQVMRQDADKWIKAVGDAGKAMVDRMVGRSADIVRAPQLDRAVKESMAVAKAEREKRKELDASSAALLKQRKAVGELRKQYEKFRNDAKTKIEIEVKTEKINRQINALQKQIRKALVLDVPDRRQRQQAFEERRAERGRGQDERREDNARANKLLERIENGQHVKKQNLQWLRDQRRFHRAEQLEKRNQAKIAKLIEKRDALDTDRNQLLTNIHATLVKNLQAG